MVAVLLDNFIRAVNQEKFRLVQEEERASMRAMGMSRADAANPLDPLLESLSRFKHSVGRPLPPPTQPAWSATAGGRSTWREAGWLC